MVSRLKSVFITKENIWRGVLLVAVYVKYDFVHLYCVCLPFAPVTLRQLELYKPIIIHVDEVLPIPI